MVICLPQMMTVLQKPATKHLMRTWSWGMWRLSGKILHLECGWPIERSSLPFLAPPWPLTAAGAACWEPDRWCWLRDLFCTSWAGVSEIMVLHLSYRKNPNKMHEKYKQKHKNIKVEFDSSQFKVTVKVVGPFPKINWPDGHGIRVNTKCTLLKKLKEDLNHTLDLDEWSIQLEKSLLMYIL